MANSYWRAGDLTIWDNRCGLHRGRPHQDANHPRDLRRVTTENVEVRAARGPSPVAPSAVMALDLAELSARLF
jgi:hypothetical protein